MISGGQETGAQHMCPLPFTMQPNNRHRVPPALAVVWRPRIVAAVTER